MVAIALALLLSAVDAIAGPSPAATLTPTPKLISWCLLHVCLGDGIAQTFDRLGDGAAPTVSLTGILSNFDTYGSDLLLDEQFSGGVVVTVRMRVQSKGSSNSRDPWGVRIGVPTAELQQLRGPADQMGDVWRYGPAIGPHWLYYVKYGFVDSITVTSLTIVPN